MELSDAATGEQRRNQEFLAEFDRRKAARTMVVPTDDGEVKNRLRDMDQPICLFGEGAPERRDRLRTLLSALSGEMVDAKRTVAEESDEEKEETKEVWYHEGTPELLAMRRWIADYSLPRASERLKDARIALAHDTTKMARRQQLHVRMRTFANHCSQVGDTRPASFCEFSPRGNMLATGSWSGVCKVWSVPDCKPIITYKGHTDRIGAVVWHPGALSGQGEESLNVASCAADGLVHFYSLKSETPMASLANHGARIARIAFHPSGRLLATACFDKSWRLWDVERREELLFQEGHSREVYAVAMHPDGSLLASAGLDALVRIWDLRTGRNVMVLQGHMKDVLAVDFAPNGSHLASGGEDHTVKLWDLREDKCMYTLPAHTNLISSLKYEKTNGDFLVSGSYDNTAKIWTTPACASLRTLSGHEGKVMGVDVSSDNKYIVTSSYDRTFKLWCAE